MNAAQLSQIMGAPWRQGQFFSAWGRWLIGGLLVILHGCWMALAASLQEQNHPHAARCVPGHLRALRQAAVLGWAACSVLTTLLSVAILPAALSWQVQLLVNSLLAVFLLWTLRRWWLWLLMAFHSPLLGFFGIKLAPLWQALTSLWAGNTDGVLLLALLAQTGLVTRVFGNGNAGHRARYGA